MHAGHQELVVAGVLHNALAALGGFRLVHVVVGVDFGVVLLQGVTVHQVANDNQICNLECGVARRMPDGVYREHSVGERVAKCEQVKAILVERHDVLLQIVFRDVIHPGVVFHLARIYGGVLESLRVVAGFVLCHKARDVVHVEMREVDKPDAVGVHAESGKAVHELPAECPEACVEQDVLAVDLHEERAHAGRDSVGHVQAVVERVAGVAEERARVQLVARVVLNPGDRRAVCEGYSFRTFDLSGSFNTHCFCGGGFLGCLGIAAGGDKHRKRDGSEDSENFVHVGSLIA